MDVLLAAYTRRVNTHAIHDSEGCVCTARACASNRVRRTPLRHAHSICERKRRTRICRNMLRSRLQQQVPTADLEVVDLGQSVVCFTGNYRQALSAYDLAGIQLIDKRLLREQLRHIDARCVDFVDQRIGRQQVRCAQVGCQDVRLQNYPPAAGLACADLARADRGLGGGHVAVFVHVDAVVVPVAGLDAQVADGRADHLGILHGQILDEHLPGHAVLQVHGLGHQMLHRRPVEGRRATGEHRDACQLRRQGIRGDVVRRDRARLQRDQLCKGRIQRIRGDLPGHDLADVRRQGHNCFRAQLLDCRHADLRVLDRRVPQDAAAGRARRDLCAAHAAGGQVVAVYLLIQRLYLAQRHAVVLPGEAVPLVARHPQLRRQAQHAVGHRHRVVGVHRLKARVLRIAVRTLKQHEIHVHAVAGQVCAVGEILLRQRAQLRPRRRAARRIVPECGLVVFVLLDQRHVVVPLHRARNRVAGAVDAAHVPLVALRVRHPERVAVHVLAAGLDLRHHIGIVRRHRHAHQILATAHRHAHVGFDVVDEVHVEVVPDDLTAALLHDALVRVEQNLHRVLVAVVPGHAAHGQPLGVQGEVAAVPELGKNLLRRLRAAHVFRAVVTVEHVSGQIVEHVSRFHRHHARIAVLLGGIDAEQLPPTLGELNHPLVIRPAVRDGLSFRSHQVEVLG